jgi:hypothetical protein
MKVKIFLSVIAAVFFLMACEEETRHLQTFGDVAPPDPPVIDSITRFHGGVRLYYTPPESENVLQIMAEYTNDRGDTYKFSSSYFTKSLEVKGMGDTVTHIVRVYAVNRAGAPSTVQEIPVVPLESVVSRVAKTLKVIPSFNAFLVNWENELEEIVNVHVRFSFTKDGKSLDKTVIITSNKSSEYRIVDELTNEAPLPIEVELIDWYKNSEIAKDVDSHIFLMDDMVIPNKKDWFIPEWGDSIAGARMGYGYGFGGDPWALIDDIICTAPVFNGFNSGGKGHAGYDNWPAGHPQAGIRIPDTLRNQWNVFIRLPEYWELSRILTHQRHTVQWTDGAAMTRGQYYWSENVGMYSFYILDEENDEWIRILNHTIPVPVGLSDVEFFFKGQEGDMALLYPREPKFTPPTRWIRYHARRAFSNNYTTFGNNCLSEITLYGRKSDKQQ